MSPIFSSCSNAKEGDGGIKSQLSGGRKPGERGAETGSGDANGLVANKKGGRAPNALPP